MQEGVASAVPKQYAAEFLDFPDEVTPLHSARAESSTFSM